MSDTYKNYDNKEEIEKLVDDQIPDNTEHLITAKRIRETLKSIIETFWPFKSLFSTKVYTYNFYTFMATTVAGTNQIHVNPSCVGSPDEFIPLVANKNCKSFSADINSSMEDINFISSGHYDSMLGVIIFDTTSTFTYTNDYICTVSTDKTEVPFIYSKEYVDYNNDCTGNFRVKLVIPEDAGCVILNSISLTSNSNNILHVNNIVSSGNEFENGKRLTVILQSDATTKYNSLNITSKIGPGTTSQANPYIDDEYSLFGVYHGFNNYQVYNTNVNYSLEFTLWNKKWYCGGLL